MTVLVALATKDSLVMGCDSLGSVTRPLVDPFDLISTYFDPKNEFKLRLDQDGNPVLKNFDDIYEKAQIVPFNHMTHVTKLFSLGPLEMGVMVTGIASIGDRTIKSLIIEFKENILNKGLHLGKYTVKCVVEELLIFISNYYEKEYPQWKPALELMVGGYDKSKQTPNIFRIYVNNNKVEPCFENGFGIAFGGQMQEIQSIVFGIHHANKLKLLQRIDTLFNNYRELLEKNLHDKGIVESLPKPLQCNGDLFVFKDWDFDQFDADWGNFSEQNAIECVNFFVEIMIKSQQFSSSLPTVGGDVHVALITKSDGFRFISREEYEHEGYKTPIER